MDRDRVRRLEYALLEYVERYGMSAKARALFREEVTSESRKVATGFEQQDCDSGPG